MQIIIEIPEEVKNKIDENLNACDLDIYDCVMIATKDGTPLPKGHGRLIDIDAVWNEYPNKPFIDCITETPTIIEGSES